MRPFRGVWNLVGRRVTTDEHARYAVDVDMAGKVEERMSRTPIIIVWPGIHEITKRFDSFSRVSGVDWFVRVWVGSIHEISQLMRKATPVSYLGRRKERKGMILIPCIWESRSGTCKKKALETRGDNALGLLF